MLIRAGLRPWSPTVDACNLVTLLRYDVPLVGLFDSRRRTVAFASIAGVGDEVSVWLYGELSTVEQAARLQTSDYDGAADVTQAVIGALDGSPFTLGVSLNEEILFYVEHDAGTSLTVAFHGLGRDLASMAQHQQRRSALLTEHDSEIADLLMGELPEALVAL